MATMIPKAQIVFLTFPSDAEVPACGGQRNARLERDIQFAAAGVKR
jgi:hypothetical protein